MVLPEEDRKVLRNVSLTNYPGISLAEVDLAEAVETITKLVETEIGKDVLRQQARQLLISKSFTIEPENLTARQEQNSVTFENLKSSAYQLTFGGAINPQTENFTEIHNLENRIKRQYQIHIDDYLELIKKVMEPPETVPKVTAEEKNTAENLLANMNSESTNESSIPTPSSREQPKTSTATVSPLLTELSAIFNSYGLDFNVRDFEVDDVAGKVFFVQVFLPQENVFLSGEYNGKEKIFARIAGASVGMQTNITFEAFMNLVNGG